MVRVMNDLFLYSEKNAKDAAVVFTVTVSFLEVSSFPLQYSILC